MNEKTFLRYLSLFEERFGMLQVQGRRVKRQGNTLHLFKRDYTDQTFDWRLAGYLHFGQEPRLSLPHSEHHGDSALTEMEKWLGFGILSDLTISDL